MSGVAVCTQLNAQDIDVELSGSDTLLQGETLILKVTIENASVRSFQLPELVGLVVVAGPSQSSQISIVNGVRSSVITYTYRLLAEQPGLALIPAVEIKVDKDTTLTSPEITRFIEEDINYIPRTDSDSTLPKRKSRPTIKM